MLTSPSLSSLRLMFPHMSRLISLTWLYIIGSYPCNIIPNKSETTKSVFLIKVKTTKSVFLIKVKTTKIVSYNSQSPRPVEPLPHPVCHVGNPCPDEQYLAGHYVERIHLNKNKKLWKFSLKEMFFTSEEELDGGGEPDDPNFHTKKQICNITHIKGNCYLSTVLQSVNTKYASTEQTIFKTIISLQCIRNIHIKMHYQGDIACTVDSSRQA